MSPGVLPRAARLVGILMLTPFVRSCDDVQGAKESFGFPLPVLELTNNALKGATPDLGFLMLDLLLLAAVLMGLAARRPRLFDTVCSRRLAVFLGAAAVFQKFCNAFIYFPLLLVAAPLDKLCACAGPRLIDLLSRLLLVLPAMIVALVIHLDGRSAPVVNPLPAPGAERS